MSGDDWFFTEDAREARAAMRAAHARWRDVESKGAGHPDYLPAVRAAMAAESAYFRLVPAHRYDAARDFDEWDVAEAETSRLEGFTPGDST